MTPEDAREQVILPSITRGEHVPISFTPPSTVTPPSLVGAAYRFAIGIDGETPLVTLTGTGTTYGQVTNPSGTTLLVVLKKAATVLLTADTNHRWTLYVTPSGDEEYVWASGWVQVKMGAGTL